MISITVKFNNTLEVIEGVKKIVQNQQKYGLFKSMSSLLLKSWWGETFAKSGARRGHPKWIPLNAKYAAWKAKQSKSRAVLRFTGHLQASPKVLLEEKQRLIWGTEVPYAEYHQAPSKRGRPPKREIIFITKKDVSEMGKFIKSFIDNVLRRI